MSNVTDQFWACESVEAIAAQQGVRPVERIEDLRGDWPEDDSIEELLASVRALRA